MNTSRSTRHRIAAVLATGAAITCVAAVAAPADATSVPNHGKIAFEIGGATAHPIAIVHGAVNAVGKDDPNHNNYDILNFRHGSFRLVHPESDATFVPHINKRTCFATFDEKGTFTVSHGTGRYAGIKGTGSYTAHGSAVLARTTSGACRLHAEPKVEIFTVHGSGTLK